MHFLTRLTIVVGISQLPGMVPVSLLVDSLRAQKGGESERLALLPCARQHAHIHNSSISKHNNTPHTAPQPHHSSCIAEGSFQSAEIEPVTLVS